MRAPQIPAPVVVRPGWSSVRVVEPVDDHNFSRARLVPGTPGDARSSQLVRSGPPSTHVPRSFGHAARATRRTLRVVLRTPRGADQSPLGARRGTARPVDTRIHGSRAVYRANALQIGGLDRLDHPGSWKRQNVGIPKDAPRFTCDGSVTCTTGDHGLPKAVVSAAGWSPRSSVPQQTNGTAVSAVTGDSLPGRP